MLTALDQMPGGSVNPQQVVPHLTARDKGLRDAALWLVSRHGEWGEALTEHLRKSLGAASFSETQQLELTGLLTRFAGTSSVQKLLPGRSRATSRSCRVRRHWRDGSVGDQADALRMGHRPDCHPVEFE